MFCDYFVVVVAVVGYIVVVVLFVVAVHFRVSYGQ